MGYRPSMSSACKERRRPIVFFGNWKSPTGDNINHSFVCYVYNYDTVTDEISYRVHYGWDGYRSVYVSRDAINVFEGD